MAAFKSKLAQEVWTEHWCVRCYRDQNDCPILQKALRTNKKPKEWERNARAETMAKAVTCTAFSRKPPLFAKRQVFEDVSMFDDEALQTDGEVGFVPVEGWPDRPKAKKDVDHA